MISGFFRISSNRRVYLRTQYAIGAAMMLTSITHGTFNGWVTACLPTLRSKNSPIKMDDTQISWVISIQFIGNMISAIPAGMLMDKYGCKRVLVFSLVLPITTWLLFYLTNYINQWELLIAMQLLSGVWIGINNTISPLFVSEIAEPHVRGSLNTLYNVCFRTGNLYSLTVALFVPYKYLWMFYSVFIIMFVIIFPLIPETPQYYIKNNNIDSARESLTCLRHNKTTTEIENELKELQMSVHKQMKNRGTFRDLLLTQGNRRALFVVEILTVLQKVAGLTTIIIYLSISLQDLLISSSALVVIVEVIRLCSGLTSSMIYDKVGSRPLLLTTSSACGVAMFLTGLWYYLQEALPYDLKTSIYSPTNYAWIPLLCLVVHGIGYSMGLNPVCTNLKNEMFPINIKGKCSAITCIVVGLTSFAMNKTYLIIANRYGVYVNFWIYSFSSISMMLFTYQFLIETSGKTLQEIQDELNKNVKEPTNTSPL